MSGSTRRRPAGAVDAAPSGGRGRAAHSARGEQARARLKEAAARVLERVGYRQMRVVDVTGEAGVAAGLFYHYFPDLESLTVEVLADFMRRFEAIEDIERGVSKGDWYGRMYAHNRLVVESYASNPGIMRCMVQVGDEQPGFGELWRSSYHRRLELFVRALPRLFPAAALSTAQAQLVTTLLAGIGEHLLSEYYIVRTPELRALELDAEALTEWISVMFYRALFLENPPAGRLKHAAQVEHLRRHAADAAAAGKDPKQTTPDREEALS